MLFLWCVEYWGRYEVITQAHGDEEEKVALFGFVSLHVYIVKPGILHWFRPYTFTAQILEHVADSFTDNGTPSASVASTHTPSLSADATQTSSAPYAPP